MSSYDYGDNINSIVQSILNTKYNESNITQDLVSTENIDNLTTIQIKKDSIDNIESDTSKDNIQDDTNLILSDSDSDATSTNSDDLTHINNIPVDDIKKIMKINYSYPDQSDPHFQEKLYKKREFYYHKIQPRPILKDYKDIKKFRDMSCGGQFKLRSQQALLSNFLSPETPFRGALLMHGTGTGKCVHPDTLIRVIDDQKYKEIRIVDLWDNNEKHNIIIHDMGGDWLSIENEIYVESFDFKKHILYNERIKHIYREYFNGMLRKITVKNDTILCSCQHSFYIIGKYWTNKLEIGDCIALNRHNMIEYEFIDNIEDYEYSGYIYDLEVHNTHSYIANNYISHNTCAAISIAENFKNQVRKYGTKIYVLVSGPLIKENWKDELIKCTKETYFKDITIKAGFIDETERIKQITQAKMLALQYYKIISYRSFYKKVLGQKISDKKIDEHKLKKKYRKDAYGEYERDISIDKIDTLDNTLLIIDEVHNITDNEYGRAVNKIIEKSKNLKILLLSATPMINFADEIIEILNYLRPQNDQIYRDMIFTSDKTHMMEYKAGGKEYLKKMASGYVSHFRGLNPLTFAEGIDMGELPNGLLFTKLYRCPMLSFQLNTYNDVLINQDDSLDRRSQSVSNFCFPGLSSNKKSITGYFGKEGLDTIRSQLKSNKQLLQKMINDTFFEGKLDQNEIIKESEKNKSITGLIFKKENIKFFSIKFFNAIENILSLVENKKGSGTVFIYFNLVKVGIELFAEVLETNGYLEYNENGNYNINDDVIDAVTGIPYKEFIINHPKKSFHPATYITMTGQTDDVEEQIPEEKKKILDSVFNNINNRDGKYIKIILGSKVMNEGITLENVAEVHIMDVYYNLGKVHQVIGRALRECKHYKMISDENRYPKVNIYRYVVSLNDNNKLTTEEIMYQKAEQKFMLVKETERLLKEVAFDCPLNYHGNIFPEETEKYKNCTSISELIKMTPEQQKNTQICPAQCDFQECTFKCFDDKLNLKYYDNSKSIYKQISKNNIDYSTFTNVLARTEIEFVKDKIKELYRFRYVYTLDECIFKIKKSYSGEKKDLFDDFFVFKALDELIPVNENDFNNFADTIYDKFNIPGYLIYRSKYYIFQPFEENEDVPMYYRSTFHSDLFNDLSLYNYLKTTDILTIMSSIKKNTSKLSFKKKYNFNDVIEYYSSKPEFDYVGIIDKASVKKRSFDEIIPDTFKLRIRRNKVLNKKRAMGIPSITGAVCETSNKKKQLINIAKHIGINDKLLVSNDDHSSRTNACNLIRTRLLYLEKYSTNKNKNKYTYLIIPIDHPTYEFPINLEDRVDFIIKSLQEKIPIKFNYTIDTLNNGIFEKKRHTQYARYQINIPNNDIAKFDHILSANKFVLNNTKSMWELIVE